MATTLELQHVWTRTGEVLEWTFDGDDERVLLRMVAQLGAHEVDPEEPSAVLRACADDGPLRAWNRAGTRELRDMIAGRETIGEIIGGPLVDLRGAIDEAVTAG